MELAEWMFGTHTKTYQQYRSVEWAERREGVGWGGG